MGTGQAIFDTAANRYFINLALTARYDAVAVGDVIRWKRSFEHASKILFNLTSGKMQLGTLTFLNNGPRGTTDDIFLKNETGDSNTTAPANIPFQTKVYLFRHVKRQPLCTIHELGHYVGTLGDEYKGTLGVCQNDPSTHECIMEFAQGHGLQLDDNGIPLLNQPPNLVQQFCSLNHDGTSLDNGQQTKHGESCWGTLRSVYDKLALPGEVPSKSIMNDVRWIERHATSRYALAIPPCDWFKLPSVDSAI